MILSLALGRVGVRSPAVRPELWPPVDLPTSTLLNPGRRLKSTIIQTTSADTNTIFILLKILDKPCKNYRQIFISMSTVSQVYVFPLLFIDEKSNQKERSRAGLTLDR